MKAIVICSPDMATGTVLFSCQATCFPKSKGSIRPGPLAVGLNSPLLSLKPLIFPVSNLTTVNTLINASLLSCFPPGKRSCHRNGNRSKNKSSNPNS